MSEQNCISTNGSDIRRRVLSIESHVVSGYVGNKCVVFPMQALGIEVDYINSVQFSNHTGYGSWRGQVLTDNDLEELFKGLKENHLCNYTHLITGYVGSESFLGKIRDVVLQVKEKNPKAVYLCDPVLGDNGHFYVPESLIPIYVNDILPLATITTPNTFELELLSGMKIDNEDDALKAMNILHDKGIPIVVLTSLDSSGPDLSTYASYMDGGERKVWKLVSSRLDGIFTGTGDLFAGLFLSWYAKLGNSPDCLSNVLETVCATMEVVLKRTRADDLATKHLLKAPRKAPHELQIIQSLDAILKPPVTRKCTTIPQ